MEAQAVRRSSCLLPGCKPRLSGQGRGMGSRQKGENEQKNRNEQKRAHPDHPLSLRLPAHHRCSFIMPDKERLSGRLHRLLKRFANSSYNTSGRKTPCCWQGDSPSAAFLRRPVPKRCKIKEGQRQPQQLPLGQAGTGRGRQPLALLPPQTHPAQLLPSMQRLDRSKHKGRPGKFIPDLFKVWSICTPGGLQQENPLFSSAL